MSNPLQSGAAARRRTMAFLTVAVLAGLAPATAGCGRPVSQSVAPSAPMDAAPRGQAAPGGGAESPADAGGTVQVVAPADRKLVFTGDMALRVADVAKAMAAARTWAAAHEGFVEAENTTGSGGSLSGNMTLRVPQDQYEATREHLRRLATEVDSDASQRQDVTAQHADIEARLKNLQATERELQALLASVREQGGSAEEILSVYRELTEIRGQVESLQAQFDALREQVALSTLRVQFLPPPVTAADVTAEWRPGDVFRTALANLVGALQGLANVAIYLLVTAPFWLILVGLAVLGVWLVRTVWRRMSGRPKAAPTPPPAPPPATPLPGA